MSSFVHVGPAWLAVVLAAALAVQTPPAPTRSAAPTGDLPLASEEVQTFVRAALEDRMAAHNIPDVGLFGKDTRIAIREDMPEAGLRLSSRALPHQHGYDFYLISSTAAQAQADRTRKSVTFLSIDRPTLTADEATVWLGADIAIPPDGGVKLCCCEGEARFRRVDGHWTFVRWGMERCS